MRIKHFGVGKEAELKAYKFAHHFIKLGRHAAVARANGKWEVRVLARKI